MNILNKVTLRCLEKNKVRTIVTIIGIILSTAMFTAVTTSISSFQDYMIKSVIDQEGKWEGAVYNQTAEEMEELISNEEVKDEVSFMQYGYMEISQLLKNGTDFLECRNESKPYLMMESIVSGDAGLLKLTLVSGRMPETENEILIPKHLITDGGLSLREGDTITGAVGQRKADGEILGLRNAYIRTGGLEAGEEFVISGGEKTYTVVGIYERLGYVAEPYSSAGYLVFCGKAGNQEAVYHTFFTVHHVSDLFEFLDSTGKPYDWHSDLLRMSGVARQSSFRHVFWGMGTILSIIIMFGSIALIYNAFSISVNERIKQFGLLSSIGATKKQLKRSVLFEACSVSLIGISLGVLAGIAGMGVTFYCLRDRFSGMFNDSPVPLSLCVRPWTVIAAALLAFFTVLISASIPAGKAMRISAIEAIRQNSEIRCSSRRLRTPGFLYRLFGLEGMLADKNFKRNRKKYRATVISLFVSIVLFISASSFVDYLKTSVGDVVRTENYDIVYYMHEVPDEFSVLKLKEEIAAVKEVAEISCQWTMGGNYMLAEEKFSESYKNYAEKHNSNKEESELAGEGNRVFRIIFAFLPDEEYTGYLKEHGISDRGYFSSYQEALVFDHILVEDEERYQTLSYLAEKEGTLELTEFSLEYAVSADTENYDVRPVFGEKLQLNYRVVNEETPMGVSSRSLCFLYPYSALEELSMDVNTISFFMKSDNAERAYGEIKKLLFAHGLGDSMLYNITESQQFEQNLILIINVFSYGFIVLISLIAAANVFNTISTNISLRRREFAMLESIGMTKKGLYRMLNYECILYGVKSILYGLPVSVLVTWAIYQVVGQGYKIGFYVPAYSIIIAVASVFLVVFTTMFYAAGKLKKNSVVETLKNENI